MRLDQYIVSKGWASSRTKAQEMIERGDVTVAFEGKAFPIRSSLMVDEETMRIDVKSDLEKYVSRAGFKMENALEKSGLNVTGKNVLDIGISTGGFSDCLLQKGAAKIVGVDVGRDQLHPLLLNDSRVTNFEQLNAKDLSGNEEFLRAVPTYGFDFIVMDLSFISLDKIIPFVTKFLSKDGKIIALFKPQFEVGPQGIGKNGIVKNETSIEESLQKFLSQLPKLNLKVETYFESGFPGRDGNREYFVIASSQK